MLIANAREWSCSDHACDRALEHWPPEEPVPRPEAAAAVRALLDGPLVPLPPRLEQGEHQIRAMALPPDGPVLVLDLRRRRVVTCYPADETDAAEAGRRIQRMRAVEHILRRYRYCYAAPGKRWPAWLVG